MSLSEQFREVFKHAEKSPHFNVESHVQHLELMDKVLPASSTFFMIVDLTTMSYIHISDSFEAATGYSKELLYSGGLDIHLQLIHSDDAEDWMVSLKELIAKVVSLKEVDRENLEAQFKYRIKNEDGTFVNVLESHLLLDYDQKGFPTVSLAQVTVLDFETNTPLRACLRYLNKNNVYESIYQFEKPQDSLKDLLSNREFDIVNLLMLGKSSKEIAQDLFISVQTVSKHRSNILKKLNLGTTMELVSFYKDRGFM